MTTALHVSTPSQSVAAGVTTFCPWGTGGTAPTDTTENNSKNTIQTPGTISNHWARVTANTLSVTLTLRIRKNGANGNSVVTFLTTVTGTAEDTTNTDSIAATDQVNYSLVAAAGSGAATVGLFACLFAATTSTVTQLIATRPSGRNFTANSTTDFLALGGSIDTGGTEASQQVKMRAACVVSNLTARVSANSRGTTCTLRHRTNGANGNGVVSITAATTGILQDTSNTDTIAVDDLICRSLTTSTGGGTLTVTITSVSITSTAGKDWFITGGMGTTLASVTNYFPVAGLTGTSTTESASQIKALAAGTWSNLACGVNTNTVSASSTIRSRINAGNGNQVVTITAGSTGYFEDTTHTDAVIATDLIDIQRAIGAGGTSIAFYIAASIMTYAVSSSYTQSLGGSATATGTMLRVTSKSAGGSVTATGAVVRAISASVHGSAAATGALARAISATVSGSVTAVGTIVRATSRMLGGSATPVGSLGRTTGITTGGSSQPTGRLVGREIAQLLGGSVMASGVLHRAIDAFLSGAAVASGVSRHGVALSHAGSSTPTGTMRRSIDQLLIGVVTAIGTLVNLFTSGGPFSLKKALHRSTEASTLTTREQKSSSIGRSTGDSRLGE